MTDRMRFDEGATLVLSEAHQLSTRLGHANSDVPHLLWALVAKGSGRGHRALRALGINLDDLTRAVETELPPPDPDFGGWRSRTVAGGPVQVTAAFKDVIDHAADTERGGRAIVDEVALIDALLATQDTETLALLKRVGLEPGQHVATGAAAQQAAPTEVGDSPLLSLIGQYGRLLTEEARAGQLDPVIGREAELRRVGYILGRRRKNNPVLLGEPGVGKTAIVEGLAQAIVDGAVPSAIAGKHLFALDVGSLVAGTKYRGEFEERVQLLLQWLADSRESIILFIDELHVLAGAGGAEGAIDAASFFKPPLAKGELRAIGATTAAEYREYIVRDGALERRFQPVFVAEPTSQETMEILRGLRPRYEAFHDVALPDAALTAAVRMSLRRLPERRLPDKALDVIDEAASRARSRAEATRGTGVHERDDLARRTTNVEVTPQDVQEVVEEWAGAGTASRLKRDIYRLGRLPRQRLATIRRRWGR